MTANLPALHELASEYREAVERLSDMDLPEQAIADTLEGLQGTLEAKSVNVAMYVQGLEATAEAIKIAEARMKARRQAMENRAERIRAYLKSNMEAVGITSIKCPYFALSIRKNPPAVIVDDLEAIPADYWIQPPPPPRQLDKKAVAAQIKAGGAVEGAHLEQGTRLDIS